MIFVVHDVGWHGRWRPQATILGLPVLHGIDAGIAWPPHNDCDHKHEYAGREEGKQT